jgi:hypothetical protein
MKSAGLGPLAKLLDGKGRAKSCFSGLIPDYPGPGLSAKVLDRERKVGFI